ncbi:cellulase [Magnaporthiopsis poae ATCC 64411]|uniref:Cellulase n=1 Tax=Magnaporthiopsis poae (strain ATCC 64411 / 73-15) TaxID=644358 RepID=A0A0C4EA49_MAGP6|nr:cellulase [Magnaporthiopsis poae ATCC 64411]
MRFHSMLGGTLAVVLASFGDGALAASFPDGPFTTSGRWIVGKSGSNLNFAGANWPGAGEAMIPEGLQYQSVASIVSRVKSLGMNAIRLTYATEMVDQIFGAGVGAGADVTLDKALGTALGSENGTAVLKRVMAKNPGFNEGTTRLQVFDAVAAECARQGIYVVLDNHVSKAQWCCTPLDGNSWWGDTFFSTANWTRGLSYMANHTKSWPNLLAMSLRNELRQPFTNTTLYRTSYNWETWYARTKEGVAAIRKENPDALVFLSGLESDTNLQPVVRGDALFPGSARFSVADFPGGGGENKIALELHSYSNVINKYQADNCTALRAALRDGGFEALLSNSTTDVVKNRLPVLLTEFGWPQQDETEWDAAYATCLRGFMRETGAGWTIWVLAGSYYTREGTQDGDEPWGLLNHDWSDWRAPRARVEADLMPLVKDTLAFTTSPSSGTGGGGGNNNGTNPKSAAVFGPRPAALPGLVGAAGFAVAFLLF